MATYYKRNKVFIPIEIKDSHKPCKLYGRYIKNSGVFNVISDKPQPGYKFLGHITEETDFSGDLRLLVGVLKDDTLSFFYRNQRLDVEYYSLYQNVFSRNKGILESNIMNKKRAVILGCGSVGSLVAVELARAGVGNFMLVDIDIVEYHNVCRHQCGIDDVGEFKVDAVERKIKNINPAANVKKYVQIVEALEKKDFDKFCISGEDTIFIGCADNRAADVYANKISALYNCYFLSIGFWERAAAGEIFYHIPNANMPCYLCAIGTRDANRAQAYHKFYTNQTDLEKMNFEPGISIDINFVTTIGIKVALDLLNRNTQEYTPRLLDHLKQYTFICNTNNPKIGGDIVEIFSYPLQVTTSLRVTFNESCKGKCVFEE